MPKERSIESTKAPKIGAKTSHGFHSQSLRTPKKLLRSKTKPLNHKFTIRQIRASTVS